VKRSYKLTMITNATNFQAKNFSLFLLRQTSNQL